MVQPVELTDERWQNFQHHLRTNVSQTSWQTWLRRLRPEIHGGSITLTAPSEFHLRWVMEKHGSLIHTAFDQCFGDGFELLLDAGDPEEDENVTIQLADSEPAGILADTPDHPTPARLVQRYTFDHFVVGPSNRFAWAAAQAVAEQPGTRYNPLFIYGGAGLGKTHLLHAVGQHALELYPGLEVRYVTSETFFSEFIDSIRRKRMDDFKARYRTTDILLLDDVQFFEGKEQILEEFFHTFNSLYESGKQMIISSDRHPRNLSTLEDRLRSRFEWGLLTDIQPPDVETRLAILRRNSDLLPKPVPDDVLHFIASIVSDNIRELEGALTRVSAFASLTASTANLEMAERVLQDLVPGEEAKAIEPQSIITASAAAYAISLDEITGKSRRQPIVLARQVAMYLCRELTDLSLPKIGSLFGGRDHTTVMHAIDKITRVMQTDREVFDMVSELSQNLRKR